MPNPQPKTPDSICLQCQYWDLHGEERDGLRQCTNKGFVEYATRGMRKQGARIKKENLMRTTWNFFCNGFMKRKSGQEIETPKGLQLIGGRK